MRLRSKILLTVGLSCLSSAVLAGGAMADGGHGKGKSELKIEVRGLVTALTPATPTTPGSITVTPGTLAPWTCTLRPGADTTGITVTPPTSVKLKCRDKHGVLTAKRLRTTTNTTGKVKVEATGVVTAFTPLTPGIVTLGVVPAPGTPGSITINPGTGLPLVTCAITDRTRIRRSVVPQINVDTAKVECKSKDGLLLVAKKIKVKHPKVPAMYGIGHKKGHH
jgi:hypothetical protein